MTFEEVVKYMSNKYPDYDVHQISAISSEYLDGFVAGKIAGKCEAMQNELAWLDENLTPSKVVHYTNTVKAQK